MEAILRLRSGVFGPAAGLLVCVLLVVPLASAAELQVLAAASLTDVMSDLGARYEHKTGTKIRLNLAASSTLARQISAGAPADVFISADDAKMDELARKGLIRAATRTALLSNTLAIITPVGSATAVKNARDLLRLSRVAIADPQTVPVGIYAREFLERAGVWSAIQPRLIPTANARATLAAVASGNVDAGIVYKTDAKSSRDVRVEIEITGPLSPKIVYPAAVLTNAQRPAGARRFLEYLRSAEARRVFLAFGFAVR